MRGLKRGLRAGCGAAFTYGVKALAGLDARVWLCGLDLRRLGRGEALCAPCGSGFLRGVRRGFCPWGEGIGGSGCAGLAVRLGFAAFAPR